MFKSIRFVRSLAEDSAHNLDLERGPNMLDVFRSDFHKFPYPCPIPGSETTWEPTPNLNPELLRLYHAGNGEFRLFNSSWLGYL